MHSSTPRLALLAAVGFSEWLNASSWQRQGRPSTARGALALAHGGPLGSRAALRPLAPRSLALEPH